MKPDFSLANLHYHGLCTAIERGGVLCFNKKHAKGFCYKHYDRMQAHGSVNLPEKVVRKCKFIDCDNLHHCKGYCKKHFKGKQYKSKVKCSVDECNNPKHGQGLCSTHQMRLKKHGDVNIVLKSGFNKGYQPIWTGKPLHKECIVPGCSVKYGDQPRNLKKGLCNKHYCRWRKHGDYNVTLIQRKPKPHCTNLSDRPSDKA